MSIIPRKASQFELFPGAAEEDFPRAERAAGIIKDLTLSLENIIVLCIVFVMTLVFFFSCGVERGKRLSALGGPAQKAQPASVEAASPGSASQDLPATTQGQQVVIPVEIPREVTDTHANDVLPQPDIQEELKGLFTIQVASFKQEENALKEADHLKGVGHSTAFVRRAGTHSIVCVGKFSEKTEADRYSRQLKKKYNDCLVRSL